MNYIRECILELKKSVFPTREEMKRNMVITVATIVVSATFLYLIGTAVLELFTNLYD